MTSLSVNFPRYNSVAFTAQTVAELRSYPVTDIVDDMLAFVASQASLDDGNGGIYFWSATSTDPDDGLDVIAPAGIATGRWNRRISNNTSGDVQLRADLGSSAADKGSALVAFKQSGIGAVGRTIAAKAGELMVTPDDFGGVGSSTQAGATDQIAALEAARDALIAAGGGVLLIPRGKYYGVSRDFVIETSGVRLEGRTSRSGGIVGLSGGTFTKAVVRIGGANIIFSSDVRNLGIIATDATVPALALVGQQENCVNENVVAKGSLSEVLRIEGAGSYSGGSSDSSPVHKATFRDFHVITGNSDGAGTPTKGVLLRGVLNCVIEAFTSTVPPALSNGTTPQDTLGTIGIEFSDSVTQCRFRALHVEGFASPVKFTGATVYGNEINGIKAFTVAGLAGGETVVEVATNSYIPLRVYDIYNGAAAYTNMAALTSPSTLLETVTTAQISNGRLSRFCINSCKNNGAGVTRNIIDFDTKFRETRPIEHQNIVYHSVASLAVNSTSPAVNDRAVYVTANTAATTISNFASGTSGQELTIIVNDANTTIQNSANIKTLSGTDLGPATGHAYKFVRYGSIWYQC